MPTPRPRQPEVPLVSGQLDLFAASPAAAPTPDVGQRWPSGGVQPDTLLPGSRPEGACEPPAASPPDLLRHPKANRACRLGAVTVAYEFQRSQRRTVGLNVGPLGLSVRAPRWTPLAEVEGFLRSKADWVLDKLRQVQERQRLAPPAQVWAEGARITYLGQECQLVRDPAHGFEGAGAALQGDRLLVGLPLLAGPEQWRLAVQAWLRREALALFTQRLDYFAPQLGVRHTRVGLSNAGTRWGSARADGAIRLHWRLVQLPLALVDYVVVHELSHLREMNHSPAFWRVVESVLPDQDERRRALRRIRLPLD